MCPGTCRERFAGSAPIPALRAILLSGLFLEAAAGVRAVVDNAVVLRAVSNLFYDLRVGRLIQTGVWVSGDSVRVILESKARERRSILRHHRGVANNA